MTAPERTYPLDVTRAQAVWLLELTRAAATQQAQTYYEGFNTPMVADLLQKLQRIIDGTP
jgi:hypothetical protein